MTTDETTNVNQEEVVVEGGAPVVEGAPEVVAEEEVATEGEVAA